MVSLVAPSGMTYRVLALDSSARYMTLPVLKKMGELASTGIHVVGTLNPNAHPA